MNGTHALDHVGLSVADYAASKKFYLAALKPLGWSLMMEFPSKKDANAGGFGVEGKPYLWLGQGKKKTAPHIHIAIGADSRRAVDAFYKAAIKAGGKDNGEPGIRAHYHPTYYAAFVIDPDGHNIEAVCHKPE